ncbi:MAG: hypothetical protein WAM82_23585 [Thermoanaerobaculia bacterium]
MPSHLYQSALASLDKGERSSLVEFEQWVAGYVKDDLGRMVQGKGVLANIREESHLLGHGAFGDCAELAGFLKRCALGFSGAATDEDRYFEYESACSAHEGRGMPVERTRLPDNLLRYSKSHRAVLELVETFLGRSARFDLERGTYRPEEAFADLAAEWDSSRAPGRLAAGDIAFATFDHEGEAPRNDARALAQILALPVRSSDKVLVEYSYPTDAVRDYRFPTVADVGWMHEFQPAPELAPDSARPETQVGWTRPIGGGVSQPELVHGNEALRVLDRPPRLVGRLNS